MQADRPPSKSRKRIRGAGADGNGEQALGTDAGTAKTYSIRSRRTHSKSSVSQDEHASEKPNIQTADSQVGNNMQARLVSLRPSTVSQNVTHPSNTSKPSSEGGTPTSTPSTSTPTLAVKELQQLLSQYVQRQRANLAIGGNSPTTNLPTSPIVTSKSSNMASGNTTKPFVDAPPIPVQKSTIIANKFSNAINKYTINTPTSSNASHYAANESKHSHISEAYTNSSYVPSRYRQSTSTLDRNTPILSVQYNEKRKEKRPRTDYDDSASSGSEANYFLLAAQHELQNMDEELHSLKKIELLEFELDHLRRSVAMRDRVIRKLHEELEEKDTISHSFLTFF